MIVVSRPLLLILVELGYVLCVLQLCGSALVSDVPASVAAAALVVGVLAIAALLGPELYGRYAIASTVSVVLAMALFDWLRLSATRFYGEACRTSDPTLRATLNLAYLSLAAVLALALLAAVLFGTDLGLGPALLAAAVFGAVSNGWFDFYAALARARFLDRTYATLVIVKNVLAIGLGVAAALLVKDPAVAVAATSLGAVLALVVVVRPLADPAARLALASGPRLGGFLRYGAPIVAANVVLQLVVLMNRSDAAATLGFAEAGRLALATDLGLRLLLAVGSAIDVLVFQLAVRREAEQGAAAASDQLRRNVVIVVAVLVLLGVGYAMAMPAFEAVLVPVSYRGAFGSLSLVLLPGIMLLCFGQFAVNPVFQMAGRTGPVVVAALVTLAADAAGLALVPPAAGAAGIAGVHSASLVVGGATITALAVRTCGVLRWTQEFLGIALAGIVTALAMWPLRSVAPAWLSLGAATAAGTLVYGSLLVLFDVADLRALVLARIGARWRSAAQGA